MRNSYLCLIAGVGLAIGVAVAPVMAEDYNHQDWPVANDGNGIYTFTDAGKAKAIDLCTAFYTADIQEMDKHGNAASGYGQILRAHGVTMRDAYATRYTGSAAQMDEMVLDMIWHFGNAAQYQVFQGFKDSANMACEGYALDNGIVTIEYLNSFADQLISAS